MKKIYGLIGKSVKHSFSKLIHEEFGGYPYELFSLADEANLAEFIKAKQFRGLNVTIPYKETVIPLLDKLDERAAAIGAVNTIVNRDGALIGYNTDYYGFDYTLEAKNIDVAGQKVLVLGAGGASKAVCAVLRDRGAGEIIVTGRSARKGVITIEEAKIEHDDADIIINATPMGMYPDMDAAAINMLDDFPYCEAVVDLIYNPLRTKLLSESLVMEYGGEIIRANGLLMVAQQARKAAELFGESPFTTPAEEIAKSLADKKRNIVLIGMPASGKTAIGRLLAEKIGKSFVDIDALIEKKDGCLIREIFAFKGEAHFRALEHDVAKEVSLLDGHVIATGGGIILDRRNIDALERNGALVFLDRPLEQLTANDDTRPLSGNADALAKLYTERYDLYKAYCDIHIKNNNSEEATIDSILKELDMLEETL